MKSRPFLYATPINRDLLNHTSTAASQSPRLRKNHNFHHGNDAPCHRLLNAVEPDSYIPPHRHLDPNKAESILVLRGQFGILIFNPDGSVSETWLLEPNGDCIGIDLPAGIYHSLVALAPGSLFFEAKAGPYVAISADERAAWAPAEGDANATTYLTWMKEQFAV